mmetsp:Transcript_8304/g.29165  ORF Transcript_8304/g.29165 Transcript_8304/m.29165 type:complete len:299 (-) Transcript_8304:902-1798(-)
MRCTMTRTQSSGGIIMAKGPMAMQFRYPQKPKPCPLMHPKGTSSCSLASTLPMVRHTAGKASGKHHGKHIRLFFVGCLALHSTPGPRISHTTCSSAGDNVTFSMRSVVLPSRASRALYSAHFTLSCTRERYTRRVVTMTLASLPLMSPPVAAQMNACVWRMRASAVSSCVSFLNAISFSSHFSVPGRMLNCSSISSMISSSSDLVSSTSSPISTLAIVGDRGRSSSPPPLADALEKVRLISRSPSSPSEAEVTLRGVRGVRGLRGLMDAAFLRSSSSCILRCFSCCFSSSSSAETALA